MAALAEAVEVLARGLAGQAARRAHELLLLAKSRRQD
jgi:hypothetical protein